MTPADGAATGSAGVADVPRPITLAAGLTVLEAVGLLGLSLAYLVQRAPSSRLSAPIWIAVALLLLWLARGLLRLWRPALTPVVLGQLLALPVGWSLLRDGQRVAGPVVLVLAIGVLGLLFGTASARTAFR